VVTTKLQAAEARELGGCACGAVRYVMNATPILSYACHCTDCQHLTGSAFILSAWIEKTEVELLSGDLTACKLSTGEHGSTVHFCPRCGTSIWTEYSPGFWFVRLTTLDNQTAYPPDMHIFTRSKQPWLNLSDAVPVFENYYDRETDWPAEKLARYRAVAEAVAG
jgi:hypothetical protein